MARNFSKMTKDELHRIVHSKDFDEMDLADLNALRKAAAAAGILDSFDGDKIAVKINNKTYDDIVKADDKTYSKEEKALAKDARDEYNSEIRSKRAKEILKRASIVDGKYVFDSLLKEEAALLEANGYMWKFTADKEIYQIGQQKDQTLLQLVMAAKQNAEKREAASKAETVVKPAEKKTEAVVVNEAPVQTPTPKVEEKPQTPALPADLQKSYDFWNKFNENQKNTGVKYTVDNIENKHLLVEAKKGEKTLFKGIDHGSKGFDILKQDKEAEAYEMFDMLVKKVKARNPKTVIRVKDNVTDEVLRNKILIACAKNNMKPVGNLPEGFDFEELKELVKELKTTEDINALAEDLYRDSEFSFGQGYDNDKARSDKEKDEDKAVAAAVVTRNGGNGSRSGAAVAGNEDNNQPRRQRRSAVIINVDDKNAPVSEKEKDKETPAIVPVVAERSQNTAGTGTARDNKNDRAAGAVVLTNDKKNKVNTAGKDDKKKKTAGFWGNLWDKAKTAVVIGAVGLATLLGIRGCSQSKEIDRKNDDIEALAQKNDSLLTVIDGKDKDIKTLQEALDDCNESKKPKPVVRKKKTVVKTPAVVKTPVKKPEEKKPEEKKPEEKKPEEKKPVQEVTPVQEITPAPEVTPVQEEPKDVSGVDMGRKHQPAGLESTPNAQDAENAARGVVDFGRRHGPDYDGLSHDDINIFDTSAGNKEAAAESAGTGKKNEVDSKTFDARAVNFYASMKGYGK